VYDARSDHSLQEGAVSESPASNRDPLSILSAGAAVAARSSDLEEALSALLRLGAEATDAPSAAIFLEDPDRPGLQLVASHGLDDDAVARLVADVAEPTNPFAEAAHGALGTGAVGTTTSTGAPGTYLPLVVSSGGVETTLGSIGFASAGSAADPDDEIVLGAIADLAAGVIERARLGSTAAERSEWFERMAHTDPLTGLANERTVGRMLELELARAGRQGGEVSLALFDVDDFQATNRESGHEVGDDVLRRVAAVLADSVRLVDTVGRIGGDEFILVAPGSAGMTVARRVLEGIGSLPAVAGRPVSVSAGVARFPNDGVDANSLIAAATAALEHARADGRGMVSEMAITSEG
jgi:diguanylate cyclase (GGDEF)-like protein